MDLNPIAGALRRVKQRERRHRRGVSRVTTEVEMGMMWPQAQGQHQELEEANNGFFPKAPKRCTALPDFQLLVSRAVKE